MEAIYGKEYFPQLWGEWVDAMLTISQASPDKNICKHLLTDIQCPTLIVHGAKDAMVAKEHPDMLQSQIQGSKVVIFPDGKHNLHFKYKERFNELVEQFLIGK